MDLDKFIEQLREFSESDCHYKTCKECPLDKNGICDKLIRISDILNGTRVE